jgi:hypothetical protein
LIGGSQVPRWLVRAERWLGWIAVPQIAILLITLQILGFLCIAMDPAWFGRLALLPDAVLAGEYWRLVTFLALPVSTGPFWMIFALWFMYFILQALESEWGAFRTTFYVLVSVVLTAAFSLVFRYPVTRVSHFESTLFLAAASLFPQLEVQLFFVVPVKMKWLAWLTVAFILLEVFRGAWIDRFFILAIYSNFLLFFGPAMLARIRQFLRRREFQRKMRE